MITWNSHNIFCSMIFRLFKFITRWHIMNKFYWYCVAIAVKINFLWDRIRQKIASIIKWWIENFISSSKIMKTSSKTNSYSISSTSIGWSGTIQCSISNSNNYNMTIYFREFYLLFLFIHAMFFHFVIEWP